MRQGTFAAVGTALVMVGLAGTAFAASQLPAAGTGSTGGSVRVSDASMAGMMGKTAAGGTMRGGRSKSQPGAMAGTNSAASGMGGMMGMMGTGMMGAAGARLVGGATLATLVRQGNTGATVDRSANTVRYDTASVTLVALASPDNKPNMTWEIDGLVNPAITVPSGARLTVDLINTDWGHMHGFELTTTKPPYPYMSMMAITNDFLLMPVPQRTTQNLATARFFERSASVTLASGIYHYLCPMPGHAHKGMHGRLIVQP